MPTLTRLPDLGGGSVLHAGPPLNLGALGVTWGGALWGTAGPGFTTPGINPNAPPVNIGNAPPPRTPDDWGPLPASGGAPPRMIFHTGPINPRGRPRRRSAADYASFQDCVNADPTDTGVEACAEAWGLPRDDEASAVPLVLPGILGGTGVTVGGLLGPIIAGVLLWPTSAGKGSDLRDLYAVPAPASPSRRPGRRRRAVPPPGIGTRPTSVKPPARPVARPSSGPVTISRPRIQAPAAVSVPTQAPRPTSLPAAVQIQVGDITSSAPGRVVSATPAAPAATSAPPGTILSTVSQWLSKALPYLPLAVLPATGALSLSSPRSQASTYPLTNLQPNAVTSPATAALPQSDSCSKARTRNRNKRRKKPCTNPTVSSRLETRGGKRYQIIKRWLKCPASSRKKRRSLRAV